MKVGGGQYECMNVETSVGMSGQVCEGRAKCLELCDGVMSVWNVYGVEASV